MLTDEELRRLLYCFTNASLLDNGSLVKTWENSNYHIGWCSTLTFGKVRVDAYCDLREPFSRITTIYVRRPVLWFFWQWVTVSGDGPWWDVIRAAITPMEEGIRRSVTPTNELPAAKSGTLSLVKFCDDHAWTGVGECPECEKAWGRL